MRNISYTKLEDVVYRLFRDSNQRHYLFEVVYTDDDKKTGISGPQGNVAKALLLMYQAHDYKTCQGIKAFAKLVLQITVTKDMRMQISLKYNDEFKTKITADDVNQMILDSYNLHKTKARFAEFKKNTKLDIICDNLFPVEGACKPKSPFKQMKPYEVEIANSFEPMEVEDTGYVKQETEQPESPTIPKSHCQHCTQVFDSPRKLKQHEDFKHNASHSLHEQDDHFELLPKSPSQSPKQTAQIKERSIDYSSDVDMHDDNGLSPRLSCKIDLSERSDSLDSPQKRNVKESVKFEMRDDSFKCEHCDQVFKNTYERDRHIAKHFHQCKCGQIIKIDDLQHNCASTFRFRPLVEMSEIPIERLFEKIDSLDTSQVGAQCFANAILASAASVTGMFNDDPMAKFKQIFSQAQEPYKVMFSRYKQDNPHILNPSYLDYDCIRSLRTIDLLGYSVTLNHSDITDEELAIHATEGTASAMTQFDTSQDISKGQLQTAFTDRSVGILGNGSHWISITKLPNGKYNKFLGWKSWCLHWNIAKYIICSNM